MKATVVFFFSTLLLHCSETDISNAEGLDDSIALNNNAASASLDGGHAPPSSPAEQFASNTRYERLREVPHLEGGYAPTSLPVRRFAPNERYEWVYEQGVSLLLPSDPFDVLIVGPLAPCIGIVFRNAENGFVLAAHKHFSNTLSSLLPYIGYLRIGDATKITVMLYSYLTTEEYYDRKFRPSHQNRSLAEELRVTEDYIITHVQVPRSNITTYLEVLEGPLTFESIDSARMTISVDKSGTVARVDPLLDSAINPMRGKTVSLSDLRRFISANSNGRDLGLPLHKIFGPDWLNKTAVYNEDYLSRQRRFDELPNAVTRRQAVTQQVMIDSQNRYDRFGAPEGKILPFRYGTVPFYLYPPRPPLAAPPQPQGVSAIRDCSN